MELNELKLALNLMRTSNTIHGNTNYDSACDVVCGLHGQPCQAPIKIYKGTTKLWEVIVYSKNEFDEWHNQSCLFGDCSRCGVQFLPLCPKEVIGFDLVLIQWKRFALETTMFKFGRALKKLTLVYKSTTINEFIDYMKPKL
jgi:hypothetical protein